MNGPNLITWTLKSGELFQAGVKEKRGRQTDRQTQSDMIEKDARKIWRVRGTQSTIVGFEDGRTSHEQRNAGDLYKLRLALRQ